MFYRVINSIENCGVIAHDNVSINTAVWLIMMGLVHMGHSKHHVSVMQAKAHGDRTNMTILNLLLKKETKTKTFSLPLES